MCHARFVLDLAARLLPVLDAGRPVVVATAVAVQGRMPRTLGTSMAWDGEAAIGSIAGGCIEGAVVEVAEQVLADGGTRVVTFGVSDADALAVGLACGGVLDLHLARLDPGMPRRRRPSRCSAAPQRGRRLPWRSRHRGSTSPRMAWRGSRPATTRGPRPARPASADAPLFVERVAPPPRLVITGAMDYSAELAAAASAVGFRVTVVDPRELFATPERFPGVEVVVAWPPDYLAETDLAPRDAVCHLAHDDRFDVDALAIALASPAFYVGALGSRRTTETRRAALAERGVDSARLRAPIGLDLGAATPAETAVAIVAEILAVRTGRAAAPLVASDGAIRPA